MKTGQIIKPDQRELDSVPVGTLLIDTQDYPLVKHDDHVWAIWAQDEKRWMVVDDGEALGHYTEETSTIFPATVMEAPAKSDNNWPQTWPVSDEDRTHYADWRYEVANGDTVLGFRAWVTNQKEG